MSHGRGAKRPSGKMRSRSAQRHLPAGLKPPALGMVQRILLYVVSAAVAVVSVLEACLGLWGGIASVAIYVLAACLLVISGYYLVHDIRFGIRRRIRSGIESHDLARRLATDDRYRTAVMTGVSFGINLIFALTNGLFGLLNHSVWSVTLAVYYVILSMMRLSVILYGRHVAGRTMDCDLYMRELAVYRRCGSLLILLTFISGGTVLLIVIQNQGKRYPGIMIFVAAMYTFYKIIMAVVHMVKAGRKKELLLMTIRNIGYADALVSVIWLQTAMFASFGKDSSVDIPFMNGLTGTAVCLMILIMGIHMIYSAGRQRRAMALADEKFQ